MQKINLLYILSHLNIGGAERQVVTILKEFDKNKYRITLCCLRNGGPLEEDIRNEDIELITLRWRFRYFFVKLYQLVRLMKRKHIHIVHAHLYSCSFWGRIAALIARVPVIIVTEHGRGLWKKRRHLLFERIANHFTDLKVAVSEDIRRIRIDREHADPDKIITLANAVDLAIFNVPGHVKDRKKKELNIETDELVVGTITRLHPDKAINVLLEASVALLKSVENIRILIVGEGHLEYQLKKYAYELGISAKVIFTGARRDIPEMLEVIDVYVNSSVREGTPVSLLEAMAAKKAIVATDVGGNADVLNNNACGRLVPSKDPNALASAIVNLLGDERLRENMGRAARERVQEKYAVKAMVNRLDLLYSELLRKKCPAITD